MALTMLCFGTDLVGKVADFMEAYMAIENNRQGIAATEDDVIMSYGIGIATFTLCNALRIREIADSYGGGNCLQDSDCKCVVTEEYCVACTDCEDCLECVECRTKQATCKNYVCNLHRGVCERPAVAEMCTSDNTCKEECKVGCKVGCGNTRTTCDSDCYTALKTCKDTCRAADPIVATCETDCEADKVTCKTTCETTETTCKATGCDTTCTNYFCNLARGDCDRT
jgi:hypothetical protein